MKKRNLLLVILAVMLVFGMVMSCGPVDDDGTDSGTGTAVTLNSVTADGSVWENSKLLTLTFSAAVPGLAASNITVSGLAGVTKGALSGTGPTYTLAITNPQEKEGALSVTVASKVGTVTITGGAKTATIYVAYDDNQIPPEYRGAYTADNYTSATNKVVETIQFGNATFNIWDTSQAASTYEDAMTKGDFLNFTLTKWEVTNTPDAYKTTYPKALKFTGRILKQKGYVPSKWTAPEDNGFPPSTNTAGIAAIVKEDGTGTLVTMYIYFNETATGITFVRTAYTLNTTLPSVVTSTGKPNEARVFTLKKN
jgi:hypothetical protein